MADRWEAWRKITSYPVLWIGAYLLWLAFAGGLILAWFGGTSPGLAAGLFAIAAVLPPGLLALSQWMGRYYYPDGSP